MRHHRKRHSWPPLNRSRTLCVKETIDEDPFAYFITPADCVDTDAGIKARPRSHSLPPFRRRPRTISSISTRGKSPTAKLKRWIERMEKQYFHRVSPMTSPPHIVVIEPKSPPPVTEPSAVFIPRSPPVRGRRDMRSTSSHRVIAGRKTPPRRPRVWWEPSEEIWSVAEEDDDRAAGIGLGISA